MIDWVIYIILIGEVFFLSSMENINYGTWFTPFNLLAIPYFIVVSLAFFIAPTAGFVSLNMISVLIWEIGLAIFWIFGSLITAICFGRNIKNNLRHPEFIEHNAINLICLLIAWSIIFISLYSLKVSITASGGWSNIGSTVFVKNYGFGWYAHARIFSVPILIYLIGIVNRKKYFVQITIIVLFFLIGLYQSKGAVIAPLIGGVMYRTIIGKTNINFRKIILLLFSLYVIFNFVYLIGWGASNVETLFKFDTYQFFFKHFLGYLFAGVLALSQQCQETINIIGIKSSLIFAPYLNLYSALMSEEIVSPVLTEYYILINASGFKSNVHTFFGTVYLFLGNLGSFLYIIIFSNIIYFLFTFSILTKNCWIIIAYIYVASLLAFGWFEFYFWLLSSIEVPVYSILLAVFFYFYKQLLPHNKTEFVLQNI